MDFELTPYVTAQLKTLKKRDQRLFNRVVKKLELFQTDSQHPSLRLHKLKGQLNDSWSISIAKNFRMLFRYKTNTNFKSVVFFDMCTHDEVYRDK